MQQAYKSGVSLYRFFFGCFVWLLGLGDGHLFSIFSGVFSSSSATHRFFRRYGMDMYVHIFLTSLDANVSSKQTHLLCDDKSTFVLVVSLGSDAVIMAINACKSPYTLCSQCCCNNIFSILV